MKRSIALLAAGLLVATASRTIAHEKHSAGHSVGEHMEMAGARKTVTGEIVDTGCYLGHAARGEKHVSCATKCINQGMPMGLLTSNGTLYLLTLNHDDADPYSNLKSMAGKTVSVTGTVMTRAGMKAIDVTAFKPVAATASK